MIFGLGKKQISVEQVVQELIDVVTTIGTTMDEITRGDGVSSHGGYQSEREGLQYLLGWLAIQASELQEAEKHMFSSELTGIWAHRLGNEGEAVRGVQFLQSRIHMYRGTLAHASSEDWAVRLVSHFLRQLAANPAEHMAVVGSLSVMVTRTVDTAANFLSAIKKDFTFV